MKKLVALGWGMALLSACGSGKSVQNTGTPNATLSFAQFAEKEAVSAQAATDDCLSKECKSLRQEFRYVAYVGKQIYCYWDEKKKDTQTDFDELASKLEKSITDSTSPTQYYLTLRTWASAFHDGHVNVLMKDGFTDLELFSAPVRLELLASDTDHEQLVVSSVSAGSNGLKAGDLVRSVDGIPALEAITRAEASVSGSTRRMRRFYAARRLTDVAGVEQGAAPLTLEIQRGDKTQTIEVQRSAQLTPAPSGGAVSAPATGVDNFKVTILPGGIGYLRIDAFMGSQSEFLLNQAMQRLRTTRGLLIDLRKNGGGDQSGTQILNRLAQQVLARYRVSYAMNNFVISQRPDLFFENWTPGNPFTEWTNIPVTPVEKASDRYTQPVIAITSPNCFSACDTFASGLKVNGLATIVGEGTGGGTGSPLVFELPISGHSFRYSVVRGLTAKGDPIEGHGTLPDIVIEPTRDERASSNDEQLLKAVAELKKKLDRTDQPSNEADSAVKKAVETLTPTWHQSLDLAPTLEHDRELRKLAPIDERLRERS